MNNEEILEKVIEKAVKNGFNVLNFMIDSCCWQSESCAANEIKHKEYHYSSSMSFSLYHEQRYLIMIFNHKFAKAFWGDGEKRDNDMYVISPGLWSMNPKWQYHLQVMVVQEEPLKYLEGFLGENK